jgi:hypothetical protein
MISRGAQVMHEIDAVAVLLVQGVQGRQSEAR